MAEFSYKLIQLKRQIQSERADSIREKLEKNSKTIQAYSSELEILAASRTYITVTSDASVNFLSLRMENPVCKFSGFIPNSSERDVVNSGEVVFESTAKLPPVQKMPPYTTWIFLDRNQRMGDDQSVAGRRRIYYDRHGGEALICSDSEEELGDLEARKHEFSEGEDRILRMAIGEYGTGNDVIDTLTKFVGGTSQEIQEHWNLLMEKDQMTEQQKMKYSNEEGFGDIIFLDKSLDSAIDSFDNLFCRRCLVFDCRLHGCSQSLIHPDENEKQAYLPEPEEERKPCGGQCYLQGNALRHLPKTSEVDVLDESQSEVVEDKHIEQANDLEIKGKRQVQDLVPDELASSSCKKLKLVISYAADDSKALGEQVPNSGESSDNDLFVPAAGSEHEALQAHKVDLDVPDSVAGHRAGDSFSGKVNEVAELSVQQDEDLFIKQHAYVKNEWKPFEKDLYLKGIEVFGRNSCCIARNLLSGLKTCREVYSYMFGDGVVFPHGSMAMLSSYLKVGGKADLDNMDPEMLVKSRICRKRGRKKMIKSSWKSAGHPSLWRRLIDGKDQPSKHYVPCGCQTSCGKQCSCVQNGTCCEKYCGCSKNCKNVFRGCHCAKSQCKSRQCPCFAAGRECDPDVCRNCWVSCGDSSLGEPPRQGEGQCGNMKLLLRQRQRILLARSDVAGWGAFLKNSVNKNDYLGEYTGELISHREADKRGKIYDRANSSFLFDLNDQYVLDAYRKGDKLKFANHSANPNCYAKVMVVAGDHRVGIFAKEHIEAGEELFYDYRYGPDQAPHWARRPESSKREGSPAPQGRAKKHQSG